MRVIILAAGQSRRFQEHGYMVPKPFLKIDWRGNIQTMIEHVINAIPAEFQKSTFAAIPKGWSKEHGYKAHSLITSVEIEMSKGPAHTALQIMKMFTDREAVLIIDSDVLNFTNDLYKLSKTNSCGVLVRQGSNPNSSYVDNLGEFKHIAEKKQISEYAVQGAYFISSVAVYEFKTIAEVVIKEESEPYISHVFDQMECNKYSLHTTYTPIEWGTPRDIKLSGAHIVTQRGKTECTS